MYIKHSCEIPVPNTLHVDLILLFTCLIFIKKDICISFQQNNPADFKGQKHSYRIGVQKPIQSPISPMSPPKIVGFKKKQG